jgi:RNA polymerase sigma factor (sigma-70 family)
MFMQYKSGAKTGIERDVQRVRALEPLLDSVCRRYLRRRHDIEDAMQDTFVKMISHRMDSSNPRLAGWLSSAAYTTCVDQIRREASEQRRCLVWSSIYPVNDDPIDPQDEIRLQMHEALSRLDEPSRKLLVERFYDEIPLHVIARRAGVSVSTVSRWGTAALQALASILRDMGLTDAADFSLTSSGI